MKMSEEKPEEKKPESENNLKEGLLNLLREYEDILQILNEYLSKMIEHPHDIHYKSTIENILKARKKHIELLIWFFEELGGKFDVEKEKGEVKKEDDPYGFEGESDLNFEEVKRDLGL